MLVLLLFGLTCVGLSASFFVGLWRHWEMDSRTWAWFWAVLLGFVGVWMLFEVITWVPQEGASLHA